MYRSAKGGNDTITGGDYSSVIVSAGDTVEMSDNAKGGNDTLTGGNSNFNDDLVGDAHSMHGSTTCGNDRLVSGIGRDFMWGDAVFKDPTVVTGADVFVFAPNNGDDVVNDFEQGKDHIDLTAFANLTLRISSDGQDSVIDLGDGNNVTVVGVNDLRATDFYLNDTFTIMIWGCRLLLERHFHNVALVGQ
jgi:hypothetical protein